MFECWLSSKPAIHKKVDKTLVSYGLNVFSSIQIVVIENEKKIVNLKNLT